MVNCKSATVKGLTLCLYLFSFGLFVSSCASARECYTKPCYLGDGLDMLWSVHDGEGFQLLVASMVALSHAIATHLVLFRSSYSSHKYGMLTSACLVLSMWMLMLAGTFGAKSLMITDLKQHLPDGQQFYEENAQCDKYNRTIGRTSCEAQGDHCEWVTEVIGHNIRFGCYRGMSVDMGARQRFDSVTAFSTLLSVTQVGLAMCLLLWRQDFDIGSGASGGANIAKQDGGYDSYGAN